MCVAHVEFLPSCSVEMSSSVALAHLCVCVCVFQGVSSLSGVGHVQTGFSKKCGDFIGFDVEILYPKHDK